MLLLDAASKLQLTASVAGSLDYVVSKVRHATPNTPIVTKGNITGTSATDICAVPGGSDVDTVEGITVNNIHASVLTDVTVNHVGGTTQRVFKVTALAAGESIVWTESGVLFVYDALGNVKAGSAEGIWIGSTVLTSGTSFTTGPRTTCIKIRVVGGGGGGGGCTSVAAAAAAAGGGGSGAHAEKSFAVSPNTAYSYTIGAAGAGASGAAGTNGGSSTFVVGATTVTSPGGTGGPQAVAATTLTARSGGAGGTVATNGDMNTGGRCGEAGHVLIVATPIVSSGAGGDSEFGAGGIGLVAVGNGSAATGFGAGGGGAATGASAVRTGGNATAGVILVEEYT